MTPPRPEQPADWMDEPRTSAGRLLLRKIVNFDSTLLPDDILAIEREAAAPLSVAELAAALHAAKVNCEFVTDTTSSSLTAGWHDELAAAILAEIERGRDSK